MGKRHEVPRKINARLDSGFLDTYLHNNTLHQNLKRQTPDVATRSGYNYVCISLKTVVE
jgi:hypothetical protein